MQHKESTQFCYVTYNQSCLILRSCGYVISRSRFSAAWKCSIKTKTKIVPRYDPCDKPKNRGVFDAFDETHDRLCTQLKQLNPNIRGSAQAIMNVLSGSRGLSSARENS